MFRILCVIFAVVLVSCQSPNGVDSPTLPSIAADKLFINASVWHGDKVMQNYTLAVKGGKFVYLGSGENVSITAPQQQDLQGRFVMPGFIDNHVHFFDGGFSLASVDLRDANTRDEFVRRIADYAQSRAQGEWILNGNWDHQLWGGDLPKRDWIDAHTANNPVFVMRLDAHMALANSAALKLANITRDTPQPQGGKIVLDENGEPTGVLKDNAMALVFKVIPKPSDAQVLQAFKLAQQHALSLGITHVHAMVAGMNETDIVQKFLLAHNKGLLKIGVDVYPPITDWPSVAAQIKQGGKGSGKLRWRGVKGLLDGSLGSATAWFYQPYSNNPDYAGMPLIDPDKFTGLMQQADDAGLRLAMHGIGDRAIDVIIDQMVEMSGDNTPAKRYRIEHFQHPSAKAIQRIAKHGIIAAMQPYHAIDDGRWAEAFVGAERIKTTYAFRTILDAGGILTFGSDWPVAPLSPMLGVHAAVTRQTIDGNTPDGWQPQEKISVAEALTAYTQSNAYSASDERSHGSIEVGKQADFVVLDANPLAIPTEQIQHIQVLQTFVDGELVYQKQL